MFWRKYACDPLSQDELDYIRKRIKSCLMAAEAEKVELTFRHLPRDDQRIKDHDSLVLSLRAAVKSLKRGAVSECRDIIIADLRCSVASGLGRYEKGKDPGSDYWAQHAIKHQNLINKLEWLKAEELDSINEEVADA